MNNDKRLEIILSAVDETKQSFKTVTDSLKALQEQTKKLEQTQKAADGLSKGFKSLATAAAGLVAVGTVVEFLRSSVTEAANAQEVTTRLAQTLYTATGATEAQVDALVRQANALELTTTASADSILAADAKLATFDLQAESIERLIPSLLDYVVGENGAAISADQAAAAANGLGKALQGQTDVLTKGGFKFTEAQLHLLKTGDEMERVTALTAILDSTYAGAAKTAGETFAGSLIIAQHRIENMKESIGKALMPALQSIITQMFDFSDGVNINDAAITKWAKAIYQAVNFVILLVKGVNLGIQTFVELAKVLWEVTKLAAKFVGSFFLALDQAKYGNFKEAWATLKDVTSEGIDSIISVNEAGQKKLDGLLAGAMKTSQAAFTGAGFTPISDNLAKVNKDFVAAGDSAAGMSKEMKKALEDLAKAYKQLQKDASQELFELDQNHKKTLNDLSADIDKVRENMLELRKDYTKTAAAAAVDLSAKTQNNRTDVAGEVIKNEQRMAEIQKELAGSVGATKRQELLKELEDRKKAVTDNAGFITGLEAEVAEQRRIAGLSDLQRAIEEFNQKQQLAQNEYNAKIALANQELQEKLAREQIELNALNKKVEAENELYSMRKKFIEQTLADIQQAHDDAMKKGLYTTKAGIEKEIEMYKALAEAIKAARSGDVATVNRAQASVKAINDGVISPNGRVVSTSPEDYLIATKNPGALAETIASSKSGGKTQIININFEGAHFLGKADVAREIGKAIVDDIKLNQRFA